MIERLLAWEQDLVGGFVRAVLDYGHNELIDEHLELVDLCSKVFNVLGRDVVACLHISGKGHELPMEFLDLAHSDVVDGRATYPLPCRLTIIGRHGRNTGFGKAWFTRQCIVPELVPSTPVVLSDMGSTLIENPRSRAGTRGHDSSRTPAVLDRDYHLREPYRLLYETTLLYKNSYG